MRERGFSLLEVLIALVILAGLAAALLGARADAAAMLARREAEARLATAARYLLTARALGLGPAAEARIARLGLRLEARRRGDGGQQLRLVAGEAAFELALAGEPWP